MSRSKHKTTGRLRHDSGAAVRWPHSYHTPQGLRLTNHERRPIFIAFLTCILLTLTICDAKPSESDKTDRFLDKINEQSIAAVFNKVAYGSTTKRSIPDNAYLYTTLATPLLTTYRYSDGNQEWYRVDVKEPEPPEERLKEDEIREDIQPIVPQMGDRDKNSDNYGSDLEKDHVLPTSAPAADILKNNNNKNYNNPNRYNNDRLRPAFGFVPPGSTPEPGTRTSTGYSILRNVRPTKSMFSSQGGTGREVPSYVPPSRSFFTPPLPPEYLNPFADKPTLRGTNSESFQNRRPIPPPSLMPKKDRIPFRPDLPPSVNSEPLPPAPNQAPQSSGSEAQRKKTLNTPSQNVHLDRLGEFYGLNRLHNESNFEYEPMVNIPSISRILSGSNGRKEDIPDILLRTVTAAPPPGPKPPPPSLQPAPQPPTEDQLPDLSIAASLPELPPKKPELPYKPDTTTTGDILNLPNVKMKPIKPEVLNATKAVSGHHVWHICWNVHVYLVVFLFVVLALFSVVKLVRFERDTHMFSKSYFLSVHLLLTVICLLRVFYLVYDPYNINNSYGSFTHELLHNFPLSLLATTFAILIVFLLKRTLNHLKVKTRPVFLVLFGLGHIFLCFCLNLAESFDLFPRGALVGLTCRFVYILLCWALGLSYVYLYKIIKNVLAKKSQNLSEMCSRNISYASHVTIAVALLFALLGAVQLYGLVFIPVDRFTVPYHWILWGFELSVRLLEVSIITLLAIVVSLKLSQREKQTVGFPLFPCTTSDSSTDNIYPNNCATNLNALNYSLRAQQNVAAKSGREMLQGGREVLEEPPEAKFERFERPNWAGEREMFPVRNFERGEVGAQFERGSGRLKPYEKCRYYAKTKYDADLVYNSSSGGGTTAPEDDNPPKPSKRDRESDNTSNVYSEPLDLNPTTSSSSDYERSRFSDHSEHVGLRPMERCSSRQSWTNSGRRSTGRSNRSKASVRAGVHHTLPAPAPGAMPGQEHAPGSMLVDENGFVRFRGMGAEQELKRKHHRYHHQDASHYSDA